MKLNKLKDSLVGLAIVLFFNGCNSLDISNLYNPQNQKSRFQKRKIKKNGKRFVDSLYSLIDLKTI